MTAPRSPSTHRTRTAHARRTHRAPHARAVVCRLGFFLLAFALSSTKAVAGPVSPTVLAGLESEKPRVRIASIVAIAKSDDENARRYLEGMAKDKDATVRAAVCEALARQGDDASLPVLHALNDDESALVKRAATKAIAAFEKRAARKAPTPARRRVIVDVSEASDASTKAAAGVTDKLRAGVKDALTGEARLAIDVRDTLVSDGFGLLLRIKSVDEAVQDGVSVVQVRCEMTLVKRPENALRLVSAATAGAGIEGTLTDADRAALQHDAVAACAPELARDFVDYALTRAP